MILPFLLITTLFIFVLYSIINMLRNGDDVFALAFFVLYIYTFFVQIGYVYFPDLSMLLSSYFGPDLFYKYWLFMSMSFLFSFIIYRKFKKISFKKIYYNITPSDTKYGRFLFYIISILLYIILNIYYYLNKGLFGWGDGNPMGSQWFGLGFGFYTVLTLILYFIFRENLNKHIGNKFAFILFILFFIFFLKISLAAGARSNILYFFLSLFFYELSPIALTLKNNRRKILITFISFLFIINFLSIISSIRMQDNSLTLSKVFSTQIEDTGSQNEEMLSQKILLQDYYAPSHLLFISMNYGIIDPIETFKSNFYNSFVGFNYPFLTQTITSKIGLNYTRGEGFGYHYFVEGYNAVGWLGVFYNAIFLNIGLMFLISFAKSNNIYHNRKMLTILVLILVGLMRSGQTCNFIRAFWMTLLPAFLMLVLASNNKITFNKYGK